MSRNELKNKPEFKRKSVLTYANEYGLDNDSCFYLSKKYKNNRFTDEEWIYIASKHGIDTPGKTDDTL